MVWVAAVGFLLIIGLVGFGASAVATVAPPSDQPGRERFRFTEPLAPPSRPTEPLVELPATLTLDAAARVKLRLTRVVVDGSTVYSGRDFEPLYTPLLYIKKQLRKIAGSTEVRLSAPPARQSGPCSMASLSPIKKRWSETPRAPPTYVCKFRSHNHCAIRRRAVKVVLIILN